MTTVLNKASGNIKSFMQVAERLRWVVIVVVSLLLLWTEVYEFIQLSFLNQPFHFFELVIYAILIFGTGLFLELFVRVNREYKQLVKILEYKHSLSLDLILSDGWNTLITKLVELPAKITSVDEAYLLITNPVNGKFEIAGYWVRNNITPLEQPWDPTLPCRACTIKAPGKAKNFHLSDGHLNSYCLGIANPNLPVTALKFRLSPGSSLCRNEEEIFNNVGDEIASAILAIQDRKRLTELQSAQVAMAERRMVSAYVHDRLGQNLGYLHLKLDQLGRNETISKSPQIRTEVGRLCEVADESYEIIRDILQKLQPETIPHLTNLLKEHAIRVSRTAGFTLEFESVGKQVQLPAETQQSIFNAFHEVLNNVERHSNADLVKVLVTWSDAYVDISVSDNGIGFDTAALQKNGHFGLEIMQERIASLQGKVMVNSASNSGTIISISVPIW